MELDDFLKTFAVYILSHKRPDRIYTLRLLEKLEYTGRWFIVVDDMDPTLPEYRVRYGERIRIFSKWDIAQRCDRMDNTTDERLWHVVLFARNAVNEMAIQDGLRYFCVLDDDYTGIEIRFLRKENSLVYVPATPMVKEIDRFLDRLFYHLVQVLELSEYIVAVGIAQSGDFIGGRKGTKARVFTWWNKLMNVFVMRAGAAPEFIARVNEDVATYVYNTYRGKLFFTVPIYSIKQKPTQQNPGGMTETYQLEGTYAKSFYAFMAHPAGVKIRMLHTQHPRIHHQVLWRYTAPKIVPERYRKKSDKSDCL